MTRHNVKELIKDDLRLDSVKTDKNKTQIYIRITTSNTLT